MEAEAGAASVGERISGPSVGRLKALFGRMMRDPLFAFLLAGIGLFAGYQIVQRMETPPLIFTPEIEAAAVADFETLTGRKPTTADRAKMKKDYIKEELLFREAIARNMHLTDGETRKRLVDKVRYLIAGAPPEPGEEQLIDYYASHPDMYRAEPRSSFTQLFWQAEPVNPALLLTQLNNGESIKGDDFWLGRDFPRYGDSMVRGIFGQSFVDAVKIAPDGRWIGPIRSARGWHFVRRSERMPQAMIPFPRIRDQVRQDYMNAHGEAAIDKVLAGLKDKFDVAE